MNKEVRKTPQGFTIAINAKIEELRGLDLSTTKGSSDSIVIREELHELRTERSKMEKVATGKKATGASFRSLKTNTIANDSDSDGKTLGSVFRQLVGVGASEKRAIVSSGSALIQDPIVVDDVVYSLQSNNQLAKAGVQFVAIDNNTQVPKITAYPSANWITEGTQLTETQPTIGSIKWELKDIAVMVKVQNNVLYDANVNVERLIQEVAMRSVNDTILKGVLYGTGASGQPEGLDNITGVQVVSMGTNGSALTNYTKHVSAVRQLLDANVQEESISFLQNPFIAETLAGFADTTGQPLNAPRLLESQKTFTTTAVKSDYTQGSTSNTTRVYAGDFSKMVIGVGDEITIKLNERFADHLQTAFIVHMRIDPKLLIEDAFCIIEGITT